MPSLNSGFSMYPDRFTSTHYVPTGLITESAESEYFSQEYERLLEQMLDETVLGRENSQALSRLSDINIFIFYKYHLEKKDLKTIGNEMQWTKKEVGQEVRWAELLFDISLSHVQTGTPMTLIDPPRRGLAILELQKMGPIGAIGRLSAGFINFIIKDQIEKKSIPVVAREMDMTEYQVSILLEWSRLLYDIAKQQEAAHLPFMTLLPETLENLIQFSSMNQLYQLIKESLYQSISTLQIDDRHHTIAFYSDADSNKILSEVALKRDTLTQHGFSHMLRLYIPYLPEHFIKTTIIPKSAIWDNAEDARRAQPRSGLAFKVRTIDETLQVIAFIISLKQYL